MKLPTFLIIGVEKSGTTSINTYLRQHPQVYMSPVKEPNFLERNWEDIDPATLPPKKNRIDTFEKYCQLFESAADELAIGEVSPNYLFHHHESIERIQRYVPDAKLIVILRNPVERAHSDYLMHLRDVIGKPSSLSEQITAKRSFTMLKGFYYEPLKHFFDVFGSDRLQVLLYDDLCQNSLETMQTLFSFIGVDETFCPDMSKSAQVSAVPKSQTVNALLRKHNPLRNFAASILRRLLPVEVRQQIRTSLIRLNSDGKDSAPLSPDDRQRLIELYRNDILHLQDLIQRDLSGWLV